MKKEYFAPKMDVVEYEYLGRLLVDSFEVNEFNYNDELAFNLQEPVNHSRV